MKWVLSLCSGLGGQCEAFVQSSDWVVIRIENNPVLEEVPHTLLEDVTQWRDWLPDLLESMGSPPDVVIAAPPCLEFSTAFHAPKIKAQREGREFNPDMSILESCLDIIEYCDPKWWIVENVIGAIGDFHEYLGIPRQILGPFVFWGVFPHFDLNSRDFKDHKKQADTNGRDPLRANKRAYWPIEISEALRDGVTHQTTLLNWGSSE